MLSWYNGSKWNTTPIYQRNPEYVDDNGISQRVPESKLPSHYMARPAVVVDAENRVIVAFSDCQRDNRLSIAISESASRDDWKLYDLNSESMGVWEPTLDLTRWEEDGVLSIFYQPSTSSSISVLEWNAKSYFATVPEPSGIALVLSGFVGWGWWRLRKAL